VSKVLVSYGQHVLSVQQVSDPYNDKYKGIWICLQVREWGVSAVWGRSETSFCNHCLAIE
jgi:hypothetical protein